MSQLLSRFKGTVVFNFNSFNKLYYILIIREIIHQEHPYMLTFVYLLTSYSDMRYELYITVYYCSTGPM